MKSWVVQFFSKKKSPVEEDKQKFNAGQFKESIQTKQKSKPLHGSFGHYDVDILGTINSDSCEVISPIVKSDADLIPSKELKLEERLAKGSYGIVYKATYNRSRVAIKQLRPELSSEKNEKEFLNEAKIMSDLRSPYIVQFIGICVDEKPFSIVMEYLSNGTLYDLLQSRELSWDQRKKIAVDIARGLTYLHTENILHRDIKSLNVLLADDLQAKLADLGTAKRVTEINPSINEQLVGTTAWLAPEIFSSKSYTVKSDVYAFGMTLWEIAAQKAPYLGKDLFAIPDWVQNGKREEIPAVCPEKFANLIRFCWSKNINDRPTAENAVKSLNNMGNLSL